MAVWYIRPSAACTFVSRSVCAICTVYRALLANVIIFANLSVLCDADLFGAQRIWHVGLSSFALASGARDKNS